MTNIIPFKDIGKTLEGVSLKQLFDIARQLGRVSVMQFDDATFSCTITFETIPGANLAAKSGFNHLEPEDALIIAIEAARTTRAQFK